MNERRAVGLVGIELLGMIWLAGCTASSHGNFITTTYTEPRDGSGGAILGHGV